jgi:hypothetical protein
MRGLQDDDTAAEFNNGFKAFYNHIRLHMALKGQTPAQAAGIDLKLGGNRWMGMIQKSERSTRKITTCIKVGKENKL